MSEDDTNLLEQIFENMLESGAHMTLLHPAEMTGGIYTINNTNVDEKCGLRIPNGCYPGLIRAIKVMVGLDPNTVDAEFTTNKFTKTVMDKQYVFQIIMEPTVRSDHLECVKIRRLE